MTKCPICGPLNQFRCNCVRRSSPKVRAHLASISRLGVEKSSQAKRIKSWKRWTELVKGLSVREAWRKVWRQGYDSGYKAAKRRYERVRMVA